MHDRSLEVLFMRTGISNETGLRCRAWPRCEAIFRRTGMATSFPILKATAAERDAHELAAHGLIVPIHEERPLGRGARMRARVDADVRLAVDRAQSACLACRRGLLDGHVHAPRTAAPAIDVR